MRFLKTLVLVALVSVGSYVLGRGIESDRPEKKAGPAAGPTLPVPGLKPRGEREGPGGVDTEALMRSLNQRLATAEAAARARGVPPALKTDAPLEELVAEFRSLPPGEREPVLRAIMPKLRWAAWKSRDLKDLEFFQEVLKDERATSKERRWALIVAHTLGMSKIGGLIDYYAPYLDDADPAVRLYAIEGLVWIRGAEQERAAARFRAALDDPDRKIRQMVASFMSRLYKDPRDADLIGRQLLRESDLGVAGAMLDGIQRLDPDGYRTRLRDALPRVPDEIRTVLEARLSK